MKIVSSQILVAAFVALALAASPLNAKESKKAMSPAVSEPGLTDASHQRRRY
ncbi:MAG: hypothetical protein IPO38_05010 [Rhodocyclaceae bacterium]|nr:hypothetical protein [Rhodocyclaceae bacterium]